MAEQSERGPSIRRQLFAVLAGTLILVVAAAAAVMSWSARRAVDSAYDRMLFDPAIDISENLVVGAFGAYLDLPQKALDSLLYDQVDRLMFRITATDGSQVAASAGFAPATPALNPEQRIYSDIEVQGTPMRLVSYRSGNGFTVQVAETLLKRNRLVWELIFETLTPIVLIAALAVGLVLFGVRQALAPLTRMREELMLRTAANLRPLSSDRSPVEVAPLVSAFNSLLAKVRAANELQHRFLENAAHQLRTPLAGLQMHLELLLREPLSANVKAEVADMLGAAERANRVAKQFLALARAEGASDVTRLQRMNLEPIVGAIVQHWVPLAIERGIDLGFVLEEAWVDGDPLLLPELVNNLVDNSLRYTGANGRVTVRTDRRDGHACLEVEDNGPGIPPGERTRVLERFYRVANRTSEGTGLGLAIVKEIVDRHRGTLVIEGGSDGNQGTCARVLFPAVSALL